MNSRIFAPVAMFIPEESAYGRRYLPANKLAVQLAGVAGCRAIPEERMGYITGMGIETIQPNGKPLKEQASASGPRPFPVQRVDITV